MTVPLVGAVDTAVVGRLPDPAYIGAVAIGAVAFNFVFWAFGFLRMGTTGFVAQAYGAGDTSALAAAAARAGVLAVGIGLALIALQVPVGAAALALMDASDTVRDLAATYYGVRIWSAPAALLNYVVLGLLIGVQRTRAALAVQLFMNLSNMALDVLFVLVLDLGVGGVAAATLVSEYAAAGMGVWLARGTLRRLGAWAPPGEVFSRRALAATVSVNANIFVRTLGAIAAFYSFTSLSGGLGDLALAANGVLLHFTHVMAYGLDGFAHAAEALAGGAYGRRDRRAFRAAVASTTTWALVVALVYSLVYAAAGGLFIDALTSIPEVRETARAFLPWAVVAPLVGVWSYQLDGIFIGATRTREMRDAMLLSLAVYALAVAVLLPAFGNHGLWAALIVFLAARAVTLGLWLPRVTRTLE